MNKIKFLDVWAPWCGPCRVYGPTFEKVSKMEEFSDVTFEKLNADEDEALAAKYGVRNIPATLAVKVETDEVVGRLVGIQSEENLIKFVKETLNK